METNIHELIENNRAFRDSLLPLRVCGNYARRTGMDKLGPTARTRVKRLPKRGHYDRAVVNEVLDAGFICHIGYVIDGQPYVTPTAYWREGEHIYWHGSSASRMLRAQTTGIPVCLTVTHLDGLVLARSAFHHSMNYRSVMAFGTAHVVDEPKAKEAAMRAFVERHYPGTGDDGRLAPATTKPQHLDSFSKDADFGELLKRYSGDR
jgi:nitroimidazol reductase NimA-like FMN-containing flavoprotein (pyridoxamine 5'-phosphate oxidase superfamily)